MIDQVVFKRKWGLVQPQHQLFFMSDNRQLLEVVLVLVSKMLVDLNGNSISM